MSHKYTFQTEKNLALIELKGEINYLQEIEVISSVFTDNRIKKDVRILLDRTSAPLRSNPQSLTLFIDALTQARPGIGRPKIAIIVADEVDYGMARMLNLHNKSSLSHDTRVFFEIEEGLKWLGFELNDLS